MSKNTIIVLMYYLHTFYILKIVTKMARIIFQFEYDIRIYVEEIESKDLKIFH
jgi:hypothetical protein